MKVASGITSENASSVIENSAVDTSNCSVEYWDQILKNNGLDLEKASEETKPVRPKKSGKKSGKRSGKVHARSSDGRAIRNVFDSDDPFFEAHQIKAPGEIRTDENRILDAWVFNDKEVDAFLSRRFKRQKELCEFEKYSATDCLSRGFPEMAICRVCKQRRQAARWKRIIWIYFRMEWNEKDTTSEIYGDTSEINTYKVIRAIGNIRSARARDLRLAGNSNRVVPGNNC